MEGSKNSLFLWFCMAVLVSQNLVIPVTCRSFEDTKNYYPPDPGSSPSTPSTPSTPSGSHTPSHGSPHHHHSGGSSPTCGTPPSHGGGGSHHTPVTPTPSTPSGGGGYYNPPSTTPTPSIPTPSTPDIISPPSTPTPIIDPGTPNIPTISTPPSPLYPDPSSPPSFPGTCDYWRSHPDAILALFGWWGTLGGIMGLGGSSLPDLSGTSLTLPQALSNTRNDGIGALYREGTASLLNSMVNTKFPFSTQQVKDRFTASLVSDRAASSQAEVFKRANEGRL